jgi:hypothetical protein
VIGLGVALYFVVSWFFDVTTPIFTAATNIHWVFGTPEFYIVLIPTLSATVWIARCFPTVPDAIFVDRKMLYEVLRFVMGLGRRAAWLPVIAVSFAALFIGVVGLVGFLAFWACYGLN